MTYYVEPEVIYRDRLPYRGRVEFPPIDFDRDDYSDVWITDRTGDRINELSTANVQSVSWILNDYGHASVAVPVDDPRNRLIHLGKTEIYIEIEGVPWWGVALQCRSDAQASVYECEELPVYYEYRFVLTGSLTYTSLDQLSIATAVHEASQTGYPHRSFNITTGTFPLSGKVRSRDYERENHDNIMDILREFPLLKDGFDFGVEYDGTGRREMVFYYPRRGQFHENLYLEWGRNIVDMEIDEDAVRLATNVYATGGTNGDVKFEENFRSDAAAEALGTSYEDVVSDGSQLDVSWLADRAEQEVNERSTPLVLPTISVVDTPAQVFGVVEVGDTVPVRIQRGRIQLNDSFRIMEITRQTTDRVTELTVLNDVVGT